MKNINNEFKQWLTTLGFADSSVKSLPQYVNEMLDYLKENNISEVNHITKESIQNFFFQWKNRKNKTSGAGLSVHHINKGALAINNFIKFLKATERHCIDLKLEREQVLPKTPQVLTQAEIKAIYEATYNNTKRINTTAFGQRDRAMLAVYYGCGLRRNEGYNLLTSDIQIDKKLIYVRKGKGNKERFVPIADKGLQDIEEYLDYGRKFFLGNKKNKIKPNLEYFFISIHRKPMKEFTARIRLLTEDARINKKVSLHTFRHSIATHLLQSGMEIEQIKKFLGHASLESTQIYTHIINEII